MNANTYALMRIVYSFTLAYSFVVSLLVGFTVFAPEVYPQTPLDLAATPAPLKLLRLAKEDDLKVPPSRNWENITTIPLFSDRVINPHPFNFTIANKDACFKRNDTAGEIFLVILVKCRPNETYDRQQIRRTWGGVTQILGRRTLTMFLVGQTGSPLADQLLRIENDKHRDFIQENFVDAYHNMTHKNIMGLKWVTLYCSQVSYVLSIDSDMILNIHHLVLRLLRMPRTGFAEGNLRTDPLPHRHRSSKWYTPYEVYPEPTYAPFLNGACYVMSGDVAAAVFRESVHVRFLAWDDVFVGLVMKRVGVQPRLSPLYEQFLVIKTALKRGIAKGIKHNTNHVDKHVVEMWDEVVGKSLHEKEEKLSPFLQILLLSNVCLVLTVCTCMCRCITTSSNPAKSNSRIGSDI